MYMIPCAVCELEYDCDEMNDVDEYCVCDYCIEYFGGCCSDKCCGGCDGKG
jgi:hypothetical protein